MSLQRRGTDPMTGRRDYMKLALFRSSMEALFGSCPRLEASLYVTHEGHEGARRELCEGREILRLRLE